MRGTGAILLLARKSDPVYRWPGLGSLAELQKWPSLMPSGSQATLPSLFTASPYLSAYPSVCLSLSLNFHLLSL